MDFKDINNDEYRLLKRYMMNTYDIYISPTVYELDDDIIITS